MTKAAKPLTQWQKTLATVLALCIVALLGYWVIQEDWDRPAISTDALAAAYDTGLMADGAVVTQTFTVSADQLESIALVPTLLDPAGGAFLVSIEHNAAPVWSASVDYSALTLHVPSEIVIAPAIEGMRGEEVTLRIAASGGNAALGCGSTVSTGRFDVEVTAYGQLTVNGESRTGSLCLAQRGHNTPNASVLYWVCIAVLYAMLGGMLLMVRQRRRQGKRGLLVMLIDIYRRYRYLIKQLITRDFKVKYKASILGMLWSFLNPLLMMAVYYFVFSTLFQSDIENFPVYLMSGIVLMNYFSESTTLGLNSITGNSSLITKVYMPKMIYPLCKVLSSGLNLMISFLPLLVMMLVTGAPFTRQLLLLPLVLVFLCTFCMGMSLILSTLNVFFRDTQFLWSVLLTMWTFLTPVFYPVSIVPESFLLVFQFNPMYHILNFMRDITLHGVAPQPVQFLLCSMASVLPLLVGMIIFRRNQDRFVLYL